jgi:hypothetical protein
MGIQGGENKIVPFCLILTLRRAVISIGLPTAHRRAILPGRIGGAVIDL